MAEELRRTFALDPTAKIRTLSKGQKARAGLLVALVYRPELLVLDEPSSGLDPTVRRDILAAVIRTIADEGRTVLFSSLSLLFVFREAPVLVLATLTAVLFTPPYSLPRVSEWTASWARRNQCGPDAVESAVAADVSRRDLYGLC